MAQKNVKNTSTVKTKEAVFNLIPANPQGTPLLRIGALKEHNTLIVKAAKMISQLIQLMPVIKKASINRDFSISSRVFPKFRPKLSVIFYFRADFSGGLARRF